MFVIPIGREDAKVERLPVATFSILAVCILVFAYTAVRMHGASDEANRKLQLAVDYLRAHPHLEADQEVLRELSETASLEEARAKVDEARMIQGEVDAQTRGDQQAVLDELTRQWRAGIEALVLKRFGLSPKAFRWSAVVTHQFLHLDLGHLFGNLLFLYLMGPYLEDVWGRPLFLLFFVAGGAFSGLFFVYQYPASDITLVGASGAISAVMGAFGARFWRERIRFFYFAWIVFGTFSVAAWLVLPFWMAREILFAWIADAYGAGDGSAVAYWAHAWGFVFGVGVTLLARYFGIEGRFARDAGGGFRVVDRTVARARKALEKGDAEQAWRLLSEGAAKGAGRLAIDRELWSLAGELNRRSEAAKACERVVAAELAREDTDAALDHWYELEDWVDEGDWDVDLDLELAMAELMARTQRENHAGICLRRIMRRLGRNPSAERILRIVRIATRANPSSVPSLVRSALASDRLTEEERTELQGYLAPSSYPAPL